MSELQTFFRSSLLSLRKYVCSSQVRRHTPTRTYLECPPGVSNRRRVSSFDQGLTWRAKVTSSIPETASIFTSGIDVTEKKVLSLPCKQLTLYFAREHKEEAIPSPKVNAKSVYTRDNLQTYYSICRWRLFFHRLFIFNFSGGRRRGRGLKKGNKIKITQKLIDKNVSLKIVRIVFLLGVSAS